MLSSTTMQRASGLTATPRTSLIAPVSRPALAPLTVSQSRRGSLLVPCATRAPSALNLYTKDRYKEVQDQLKKADKPAKLGDVTSVIRGEWDKMDDKKRQPYTSKSDKLKEEVAAQR